MTYALAQQKIAPSAEDNQAQAEPENEHPIPHAEERSDEVAEDEHLPA